MIGDIPCYKKGKLHSTVRDHSQIAAVTGVTVNMDGRIAVDSDYLDLYADVAVGEEVAVDASIA